MNWYPVYYAPPPYTITSVHKSFPEHHHALEHARHSLAHGIHNAFTPPNQIPAPRADIRETLHNYYVDVELPGVQSQEHLKVKWLSGSTLIVEATKERSEIKEAPEAGAEAPKEGEPETAVHQLVREREIGTLVRAFEFPVAVDREKLKAKLSSGLLSLVVPKAEEAKVEHKDVEVDHATA
ncbi:HSP20-like chaperone [Rhizodiscina lignyota]|uniref:HSP20-like chaperone n=1 Tax=Rhizodiscina lignyota TaxID=1504668 RepID=A0A9P4IG56_9PEZI|nr:HSP20-like chaperone [Rhizodiscina lignyota]